MGDLFGENPGGRRLRRVSFRRAPRPGRPRGTADPSPNRRRLRIGPLERGLGPAKRRLPSEPSGFGVARLVNPARNAEGGPSLQTIEGSAFGVPPSVRGRAGQVKRQDEEEGGEGRNEPDATRRRPPHRAHSRDRALWHVVRQGAAAMALAHRGKACRGTCTNRHLRRRHDCRHPIAAATPARSRRSRRHCPLRFVILGRRPGIHAATGPHKLRRRR